MESGALCTVYLKQNSESLHGNEELVAENTWTVVIIDPIF